MYNSGYAATKFIIRGTPVIVSATVFLSMSELNLPKLVVLGFERNVAIVQGNMSIIVSFQKLPVRCSPDGFLAKMSAYICKITTHTRLGSDLFGSNNISGLRRLGFERGGQVPCCHGCGSDPKLDKPRLGELAFCLSSRTGPTRVKSMFISMFSCTPDVSP